MTGRCEAFQELIRTAGYTGTKYSGRGMFGRFCVAIRPPQYENAFKIMYKLGLAYAELPKEMQKELEDLPDYLDNAKADTMGHSSVIYFQAIEWVDTPAEDGTDPE